MGGFDKVFYYDALPSKHGAESQQAYDARLEAAKNLHDKIGALDRFHVYEGDTRRSPSLRRQEQKKVDVMITVDMLTHAFRRNMQHCTLLTGDLDFKPLIDALVSDGMTVTLWYPPKRTSRELIAAADQRRQLDVRSLYDSLRAASKQLFTLPDAGQAPDRGDIAVIDRWTVDGDEFRLVKDEGTFVIIGPSPNANYKTYWSHADQALLRLFAEDVLLAPATPDSSALRA
jgi:uncharacterized LabA/DUF88 family protein